MLQGLLPCIVATNFAPVQAEMSRRKALEGLPSVALDIADDQPSGAPSAVVSVGGDAVAKQHRQPKD